MGIVSHYVVVNRWPLSKEERVSLATHKLPELLSEWEAMDLRLDGTLYVLVHEMAVIAKDSIQAAHFAEQGEAMVAAKGGGTAVGITLTDTIDGVEAFVVATVNEHDGPET